MCTVWLAPPSPFVTRCGSQVTDELSDPCAPGPCGANTQCRVTDGFPVCACLPGLVGNPYLGCRPECLRDTDCSLDRSCVAQRCVDPCPGTCGRRASCMVVMHRPQCACKEGYSGDPYSACFLFTRRHSNSFSICMMVYLSVFLYLFYLHDLL